LEVEAAQKFIPHRRQLSALRSSIRGTIAATNGCFDILHVGHVRYLQAARELADHLVVGVNSDSSVRQLKGSARPINSQNARVEVLNALSCVDYTFIFEGKSAAEFLKDLRPHLYIKGGDYKLEDLLEREVLEEINCKIEFLDFHEGYSSTNIIEGIRNA